MGSDLFSFKINALYTFPSRKKLYYSDSVAILVSY